MKVRLLKKTRKRFEIHHLPNGEIGYIGERYEYNLFKLTDTTNQYFEKYSQLGSKEGIRQFCPLEQRFDTEERCIVYLKSLIIDRLRSEGYRGRKDHMIIGSKQKTWYKK
jgi:hypothetical protein